MNLKIKVYEKSYIISHLVFIILGLIEAVKKEVFTIDEAKIVLCQSNLIENLNEFFPSFVNTINVFLNLKEVNLYELEKIESNLYSLIKLEKDDFRHVYINYKL